NDADRAPGIWRGRRDRVRLGFASPRSEGRGVIAASLSEGGRVEVRPDATNWIGRSLKRCRCRLHRIPRSLRRVEGRLAASWLCSWGEESKAVGESVFIARTPALAGVRVAVR